MLFFPGQTSSSTELTPEAVQKPKKTIQETNTFVLVINARPTWVQVYPVTHNPTGSTC